MEYRREVVGLRKKYFHKSQQFDIERLHFIIAVLFDSFSIRFHVPILNLQLNRCSRLLWGKDSFKNVSRHVCF